MSKEVSEERTPRTVEDVKEMLTKHSNGEIQRTIQNCITILQNDHVLADAIRLNLLSERIDIVKPVGWPRSGKTLNDTERIPHVLHHFLGAAEDEYTCEAMKIFLLGAIKRVFQPGCKFETMLCLVGGQGVGKSTIFRQAASKAILRLLRRLRGLSGSGKSKPNASSAFSCWGATSPYLFSQSNT